MSIIALYIFFLLLTLFLLGVFAVRFEKSGSPGWVVLIFVDLLAILVAGTWLVEAIKDRF